MMKSDISTHRRLLALEIDSSNVVHSTNLVDTCALYGMRELRNINDVHFAMFQQSMHQENVTPHITKS